jgi:uncharacterized protein YgiM (DUF1202 family)
VKKKKLTSTGKGKVKSRYRSAYPEPLKLKRGEKVELGKRVSEWSGWVWCEDKSGKAGWVPESYLQIRGNCGILLSDYDATELSVKRGEELMILKEQSGWLWCQNRKGDYGWVPRDKVSFR